MELTELAPIHRADHLTHCNIKHGGEEISEPNQECSVRYRSVGDPVRHRQPMLHFVAHVDDLQEVSYNIIQDYIAHVQPRRIRVVKMTWTGLDACDARGHQEGSV